MSSPTPTGLSALQPRPMTDAQVRALVQRVRRIDAESKAMRDAALVSQGNRNRMACTRGRVAARYARLVGCSLSDARDTLIELTGAPMSLTQVCEAWHRIYPRVSARAQRRKPNKGRKAGR